MPEPPERFDGWKAIAEHLGRDVRTAQRWHEEREMPVHRVPGARRGSVFAYRAELDAWLTSLADGRLTPASTTVATIGDAVAEQNDKEPLTAVRRALRPIWVVAAVLVATAALALGLMQLMAGRTATTPTHVEVDGRSLAAFDHTRRKLWSFELKPPADGIPAALLPGLHSALHLDLQGDDRPETVALVNYTNAAPNHRLEHSEVYGLSFRGKRLWSYRPDSAFTFAGYEFGGPWAISTSSTTGWPVARVWVSFTHRTWWPSFVVALGAGGAERLAFVNSGHIRALRVLRGDGEARVLAGGFNNEYSTASLAVFDEDGPAVSSPQSPEKEFHCPACPAGAPKRYFLFPRTEVNVVRGKPLFYVADIEPVSGVGTTEVSVRQPDGIRVIYTLSRDLIPMAFAPSDAYWNLHSQDYRAGHLDHPPERCPERTTGVTVRLWEPDVGWREIEVPPAFTPSREKPDQLSRR
jgi:hypothetical protein